MIKRLLRWLVIGIALTVAVSVIGCGGSGGGGETVVEDGTVTRTLVPQYFDEQCSFCHGPGRSQDVAAVHDTALGSPVVTITGVSEATNATDPAVVPPGETRLKVDFRIVDTAGFLRPGIPANDIRFTIAKLETVGGVSNWQSYINDTETWAAGDPGNNPGVPPVTVTQADYERASAAGAQGFTDHGDGTYTYIFSFDMDSVTIPLPPPLNVAIPYVRTVPHRIAMQVADNVDNAFVDFIPNNLPTLGVPAASNRLIAFNTSCNECHVRLGFHGGDRINVNYCVTCHNPGTTDANSGETVDFKVMIHKIHRGEELPVVQAGGEYAIWGNNNNKNDYTTVVFPQDIRNCEKCHTSADGATPQGDNWKNVPTAESCLSCHDDPGTDLTSAEITTAHLIPRQIAGTRFKYNILSVVSAGTPGIGTPAIDGQFVVAPGALPVITVSVQDPTGTGLNTINGAFDPNDPRTANYNIQTHAAFQPGGGTRSLRLLIGWFTRDPAEKDKLIEDYTNTDSTQTPAQPIRVDLLAGTVDNGDGTFTVFPTVSIPAKAVPVDADGSRLDGSFVVAMEGHPAGGILPGDYSDRAQATGVVQAVAISDDPAAVPQSRRVIVDAVNKCDNCHGLLSLHGANRNNNTQLCVICHNANATDINDRLADPTISLIDGKREEAIDFKYMIHSIHAGAASEHGFRTEGIVISGDEFKHVRLPSGDLNLRNCLGCHIDPPGSTPPTNTLPINANALPTTINTGADIADPDDDVNITPTASVCSACHDDIASKTHMADNGGVFDFRAFTVVTSGGGGGGGGGGDQSALCGPGPVSAQPAGHSPRTDCCSCHGPR